MKPQHPEGNSYVTQITALGNIEFRIIHRTQSLLAVLTPDNAVKLAEELLDACERVAWTRIRTGEVEQAMRELDS